MQCKREAFLLFMTLESSQSVFSSAKNKREGKYRRGNMAVNVAQIYKNSKEQTASKEDIITMMYDGAIRFCNVAITELELKNIENVNTNLKKAQRVIEELILTLDKRYPVSQEFKQVYEYIIELLVQANVKKDKEMIEKACEEIRGMRDTWVEVVKRAKRGQ